jgi:hypothetical protein
MERKENKRTHESGQWWLFSKIDVFFTFIHFLHNGLLGGQHNKSSYFLYIGLINHAITSDFKVDFIVTLYFICTQTVLFEMTEVCCR